MLEPLGDDEDPPHAPTRRTKRTGRTMEVWHSALCFSCPSSGGFEGSTFVSAIRAVILVGVALVGGSGCAAPRSEAAPVIVVSPGAAGRIALMDRFRLHDEERKLMMARPHVWVEEVSEDTSGGDSPDASEAVTASTESAKPAE